MEGSKSCKIFNRKVGEEGEVHTKDESEQPNKILLHREDHVESMIGRLMNMDLLVE
jgi:hypothetical protein